jgi:hypothetical protein
MATLKAYYAIAPVVVLKVVESAVERHGRQVSLQEIRDEACQVPYSERLHSPKGYEPFDFPDRLRAWLRRLVKRGMLLELGDYRKFYYLPTAHGRVCLLAASLEPLIEAYGADAKFTGDHVTPDLPGEVYDHEM